MLEPVGDETQNPKICTDIESFSDTYFFQDKSETCFTTKFFETKPRFSIPNLTKPCFNQTNPILFEEEFVFETDSKTFEATLVEPFLIPHFF